MKKDKRQQKVKVPFHPIIIPLFCVLFTFLVGGIIAALNWTRLLRPKWKYPTIGITIAVFIIFLYIYSLVPLSLSGYLIYASYFVFAIVGAILYYIQKPYYDKWKMGKL